MTLDSTTVSKAQHKSTLVSIVQKFSPKLSYNPDIFTNLTYRTGNARNIIWTLKPQDQALFASLSPRLSHVSNTKSRQKSEQAIDDTRNIEQPLGSAKSQTLSARDLATEKDSDPEGEAQAPATIHTIEAMQDENLVTWDGLNDTDNLMNWSTSYKWLLSLMFGA